MDDAWHAFSMDEDLSSILAMPPDERAPSGIQRSPRPSAEVAVLDLDEQPRQQRSTSSLSAGAVVSFAEDFE